MVPFQMMVYLQNEDRYVPADEVPQGAKVLDISGTELRQRLNEGRDIPGVVHLSRSGAGIAPQLSATAQTGRHDFLYRAFRIGQIDHRQRADHEVPGDRADVRSRCSMAIWCARTCRGNLGFSKEHRDINIRRIGYVASEITKNGGIAICAPIAPYEATRQSGAADD